MKIRKGGPEDLDTVIDFLDGAVAWLVANGSEGQWGTRPWSESADRVGRIAEKLRTDDVWIAELDREPVGAMTLSPTPLHYVPPADEPEVYVTLLVTSRAHKGLGVGGALLDHARAEARARGVGLLRVDCYAGGGGRLVEYYRNQGFEPVQSIKVGEWDGKLLAQRLA